MRLPDFKNKWSQLQPKASHGFKGLDALTEQKPKATLKVKNLDSNIGASCQMATSSAKKNWMERNYNLGIPKTMDW